jgi:hypothetical protein
MVIVMEDMHQRHPQALSIYCYFEHLPMGRIQDCGAAHRLRGIGIVGLFDA